jgi:hypothetical protein
MENWKLMPLYKEFRALRFWSARSSLSNGPKHSQRIEAWPDRPTSNFRVGSADSDRGRLFNGFALRLSAVQKSQAAPADLTDNNRETQSVSHWLVTHDEMG